MKVKVVRTVMMAIILAAVVAVLRVAAALPYAGDGPDPRLPDTADQLVIFRLRARIMQDEAGKLAAKQQYDAFDKDEAEAQPQYQHAVEVAKAKLPPPAKGKVWVTQEDRDNGLRFVEADAAPVSITTAPASQAAATPQPSKKP